MTCDDEIPFTGGNVGAGVVRVGNTVRRPSGPWSESVHGFLRHLTSVGYDGAPRSLGFDDRGRHVVEFLVGAVAMPFVPQDHRDAMHRVGRLIRDFHDAASSYLPPPTARWNVVIEPDGHDLITHHDLAPWNLVCGGQRWAFIDWDNAGPGTRLWDLAYAAHGFVPLTAATTPSESAARLSSLAAGYGLDEAQRTGLADLLQRRIVSMYELLRSGAAHGEQPWARLWDEGHGDAWLADAQYVQAQEGVLRDGLLRG